MLTKRILRSYEIDIVCWTLDQISYHFFRPPIGSSGEIHVSDRGIDGLINCKNSTETVNLTDVVTQLAL